MVATLMGWIVIGMVAGVSIRAAVPRLAAGGFVAPILLGIAGALLGGNVALALRPGTQDTLEPWIGAITGAVVILAIYRVVMAKRW